MTLFFANNLLGHQNQCSVFLTFNHHKIWDPMMYWMCFDINFFLLWKACINTSHYEKGAVT